MKTQHRSTSPHKTPEGFQSLSPELVLVAAEQAGFQVTGEILQLNSYENRVFDLRLEADEGAPPTGSRPSVIAKFYRPKRWSRPQVDEEHAFLRELKKEGIPVVPASHVCEVEGYIACFFPKGLGRLPSEFLSKDLKSLGGLLARLHNVGGLSQFVERPQLGEFPWNPEENIDLLAEWISPEVRTRYLDAASTLVDRFFSEVDPQSFLRIHGDFHRGNLLAQAGPNPEQAFLLVDFDDCCMGPSMQDLWMIWTALETDEERQLLRDGYDEFRRFPEHELEWVSALRGMRIVNYAAWIARRWQDPAFPLIFPQFVNYNYWAEETEALERLAWDTK